MHTCSAWYRRARLALIWEQKQAKARLFLGHIVERAQSDFTSCPHDVRSLTVLSWLFAGTEKHAENLTKAAASLLLFQNVLKGRPAQAFLKLLLFLQKGRIQDILEAYGDLYSSLAAGDHLSWQDYLLEEVSV